MKKHGIGVVAGAFDVIHPGYIRMFKEAREICDYLVVLLHDDPSCERKEKVRPVLSIFERREILESVKYVDSIMFYRTEEELERLLMSIRYDVRILGSDYVGKSYTGDKSIPVHYINRDHGWSSTKLRHMIADSVSQKGIPL